MLLKLVEEVSSRCEEIALRGCAACSSLSSDSFFYDGFITLLDPQTPFVIDEFIAPLTLMLHASMQFFTSRKFFLDYGLIPVFF